MEKDRIDNIDFALALIGAAIGLPICFLAIKFSLAFFLALGFY